MYMYIMYMCVLCNVWSICVVSCVCAVCAGEEQTLEGGLWSRMPPLALTRGPPTCPSVRWPRQSALHAGSSWSAHCCLHLGTVPTHSHSHLAARARDPREHPERWVSEEGTGAPAVAGNSPTRATRSFT